MIIIIILALISTIIVYKRFIEIKLFNLVGVMWAVYLGYASVVIYKQSIIGEMYFDYNDILLFVLVQNIILSLHLLYSKKNENRAKLHVNMYYLIVLSNSIGIYFVSKLM